MTAVKGSLGSISNDLDRIGRRNQNNTIINVPSNLAHHHHHHHPHDSSSTTMTTTTSTTQTSPSSNAISTSNSRPCQPQPISPTGRGNRISNGHPFYDNFFLHQTGMVMMPLPPPPYSTLPNRGNQRRLLDSFLHFNSALLRSSNAMLNRSNNASSNSQPQPTSQTSVNTNNIQPQPQPQVVEQTTCVGNESTTSLPTPVLPSYHHLYSSASPASMRRRRRRMLRQQRLDPSSVPSFSLTSDPSGYLCENKKYLMFVSLFVIGILLTFVGVVTLSLFTISFGFTFILFSLLLYKLLPSSKFAPRDVRGGLSSPSSPSMFSLERNGVPNTSRSPISCLPGPFSTHPPPPPHHRSLHGMLHLPPHSVPHAFPHAMHHHPGHLGPFLIPSPSGENSSPLTFSLPPPPPTYQEALTAGHTVIQPLSPTALINDAGQQQSQDTSNGVISTRSQVMSSHCRRNNSNIICNNSQVTVTTSGVTVEPTTLITVEALTHRRDEDDQDILPDSFSSPDIVSSCHTNSSHHEVTSSSNTSSSNSSSTAAVHLNNNSLIFLPTSSTTNETVSSLHSLPSLPSLTQVNNNCVTICTVNDDEDNGSSHDNAVSNRLRNNNSGVTSTTITTQRTMTRDVDDNSLEEQLDSSTNRCHFVTIIEATI